MIMIWSILYVIIIIFAFFVGRKHKELEIKKSIENKIPIKLDNEFYNLSQYYKDRHFTYISKN